MGASNYVHLNVANILKETDKAFELRLTNKDRIWVPKSVIADAENYEEGDVDCTVSVQEWWCEKNDVEGE